VRSAYTRILGGLALIVIVALSGGWVYARKLPADLYSSDSIEVSLPPDSVWNALSQVEQYPEWRPGVRSVSAASGEDSWSEVWDNGDTLAFRQIRAIIPDTLQIALTPGHRPYQSDWTWVILPLASGKTEIRLHNHLHLATPFYKLTANLLPRQKQGLHQTLQALGRRLAPQGK